MRQPATGTVTSHGTFGNPLQGIDDGVVLFQDALRAGGEDPAPTRKREADGVADAARHMRSLAPRRSHDE